jgi:hypothetical protein
MGQGMREDGLDFVRLFPLASDCRARGHSCASMGWKRKVTGGVLAFVGYMLSPWSWWNDLFVNVPLALVFAWVVSFFYRPAFEWCVIVGYWLTNVLGLVLMQKGGEKVFSKEAKPYSRRALLRDVGISLLYTGLIVLLLKLGVLKPLQHYFEGKPSL